MVVPVDIGIRGFIGLIRKSGRLACGNHQVLNALQQGRAKAVIIAEDAGPSTSRKLTRIASEQCVPVVNPGSSEELGQAVGYRQLSVAAVLDSGMAEVLIAKVNPGKCDRPETLDTNEEEVDDKD